MGFRVWTCAESLEEADGIKALDKSVANTAASEHCENALAEVTEEQPHKPRFVSGAIPLTSRSLSVSGSVEDCYCSFKDVSWELLDQFTCCGRDPLIETIFDTEFEGCHLCCG